MSFKEITLPIWRETCTSCIRLCVRLFVCMVHYRVLLCIKIEYIFTLYGCFVFRTPPRNLDKRTTITIDEKTFVVEADDLETLCVLGRGAYGIVDKMRHKQSGTIMAVKVSK